MICDFGGYFWFEIRFVIWHKYFNLLFKDLRFDTDIWFEICPSLPFHGFRRKFNAETETQW